MIFVRPCSRMNWHQTSVDKVTTISSICPVLVCSYYLVSAQCYVCLLLKYTVGNGLCLHLTHSQWPQKTIYYFEFYNLQMFILILTLFLTIRDFIEVWSTLLQIITRAQLLLRQFLGIRLFTVWLTRTRLHSWISCSVLCSQLVKVTASWCMGEFKE